MQSGKHTSHSGERFSKLEYVSKCVVSHRLWAGHFALACSPSSAPVWQENGMLTILY